MKLIILGSGGSVAIPRPLCNCEICSNARKDTSLQRTGSAMYCEDEAILFDTPEETRQQIEREKIKSIKHVFYTHWHPDDTQGLRIFEQINFAYPDELPKVPINVYIPENAQPDFDKYLPYFSYFQSCGFIKIIFIKDRVPVRIGETTIIPLDFRRNDRVRYGYLIEKDSKRAIYAPCSIFNLFLDENYQNLDLLIMEFGWLGKTKELRKSLSNNHAFQDHISFEENLEIIKKLQPKKTVFIHIEGTRHLKDEANPEVLRELENKNSDLNLKFAYDGMKIEI